MAWIALVLWLAAYAVAVVWWARNLRVRWGRPPGPLPADVLDGWVALPGRGVLVLPLCAFCFAGGTLVAFCGGGAHGLLAGTCQVLAWAFNVAFLLSVPLIVAVMWFNVPAALIPPDRRGGPGLYLAVTSQRRAGRLRYSTKPWQERD